MAKSRSLTSEELGAHGEAIFPTLCTSSKLVVNKSDRDKTGWDYRVEFPNSSIEKLDYSDKRLPPLPIMFQIKSMWKDNRSFSAPLLSVERLTKLLEPAFFAVLRFNSDMSIEDFFLVHLIEDDLTRVLKRLAIESSKGNEITNKQTINFTRNSAWKKIPQGDDLGRTLLDIINRYSDGKSYYSRKEKELRESGYSSTPLSISLKVEVKTEDELIEGFWGLRPISVVNFQSTEERFGIKRPHPLGFSGAGTLTVSPSGGAPCRLFFRTGRYGMPLIRQCSAFPPAFRSSNTDMRILVRSHPFICDINTSGKFTLRVEDLAGQKQPLEWWNDTFRLLEMMGENDFCFELYTENGQKLFGGMSNAPLLDSSVGAGYKRAVWSVDVVQRFLQLAGETGHFFKIDEILDAAPRIATCLAIVNGEEASFSARLENADEAAVSMIDQMKLGVICDLVDIGPASVIIGLVGDMTLRQDDKGFVIEGKIIQRGFLAPASSALIDQFADDFARESKAEIRIVGGLSKRLGVNRQGDFTAYANNQSRK